MNKEDNKRLENTNIFLLTLKNKLNQ